MFEENKPNLPKISLLVDESINYLTSKQVDFQENNLSGSIEPVSLLEESQEIVVFQSDSKYNSPKVYSSKNGQNSNKNMDNIDFNIFMQRLIEEKSDIPNFKESWTPIRPAVSYKISPNHVLNSLSPNQNSEYNSAQVLNNQNQDNNSLFEYYDFRNSNLLNQQEISSLKEQSSKDVIKIKDEEIDISNRDEENKINIDNNLSSIIEEDLIENSASISLNHQNSVQPDATSHEKCLPPHSKNHIKEKLKDENKMLLKYEREALNQEMEIEK